MKKLLLATTALLAVAVVPAKADVLHGTCLGCTETTIGGDAVTLIGPNGVSAFGFNSSPGGLNGDLQLKFLIPNNFTLTQVNNFASGVTVNNNGTTTNLSLFSTTPWTSGFLETTYLGNTLTGPKNPLDAFLGATQTVDPTATGYFVLTANTGPHTLDGQSSTLSAANTFGLNPAVFAQGGLILGNLFTEEGLVSTAQSSALFFNGPNSGPFCAVEPCTVAVPGPIVGAGLPGLVTACLTLLGLSRWRRRQAVA